MENHESSDIVEAITIPSLDFAPQHYEEQLAIKAAKVSDLLSPFDSPPMAIFASPRLHFRMRAEFRIWHTINNDVRECFYVMFERSAPKTPIRITQFPIACQPICNTMEPLLTAINASDILAKKLFQVEFLASSTGQLVVTLIYHRQLDEEWATLAKALEIELDISIIGRARKQKIVLSRDFIIEKISVDGRHYQYEQKENSFSQPNAHINQAMLEWVAAYFAVRDNNTNEDFIELYCGNGNFTLPLAKFFRRSIGTEISKTSIASAQRNCEINDIDSIDFVRLSGEETACAMRKEREFRRLRHIDLDSYNFTTVLVDPPRAGLDEKTLQFIGRFQTIIYISCNPTTLANNLTSLTHTHRIDKFAAFDQFPYSEHCECGVILKRTE
ncbi:tRNA (uridine(54)-C5)-methyltransferase TrmA [bacterium]|nr:tRNA (uridine(54)-C5)-methyltransferase TrmA [bacterium]